MCGLFVGHCCSLLLLAVGSLILLLLSATAVSAELVAGYVPTIGYAVYAAALLFAAVAEFLGVC